MAIIEKFNPIQDNIHPSVSLRFSDAVTSIFQGEIIWEMRDSKTGELIESGRKKNVVTQDASLLVARLLKSPPVLNTSEPKFGIFALAIGTGDVGWNPMAPPAATNTQRSLFNEIARKQVASTSYIDAGGGVSGIPTRVVDFTTTFSESEGVGPLTEMGLIGGDVDTNMSVTNPITPPNGTYDPSVNVVGKDILVNYITFPAMSKPSNATLSYTWRITT